VVEFTVKLETTSAFLSLLSPPIKLLQLAGKEDAIMEVARHLVSAALQEVTAAVHHTLAAVHTAAVHHTIAILKDLFSERGER